LVSLSWRSRPKLYAFRLASQAKGSYGTGAGIEVDQQRIETQEIKLKLF
jgi:hypothetical protein